MTKIKDEKTTRQLFGFKSSFGSYDLGDLSETKSGLSGDDLIEEIEDASLKEALKERKEHNQKQGRGRPKSDASKNEMRMTFIVNKEQLEKIREIGYRETLFTKEILFAALADYIENYERTNGEVIPRGKSKIQ